jgi:hypothetical protein
LIPESSPAEFIEFDFKFTELLEFENKSSGSNTPEKFIYRGIGPRGNLIKGAADPAEIYSEGSDTPLKLVNRGLILPRNLFIRI